MIGRYNLEYAILLKCIQYPRYFWQKTKPYYFIIYNDDYFSKFQIKGNSYEDVKEKCNIFIQKKLTEQQRWFDERIKEEKENNKDIQHPKIRNVFSISTFTGYNNKTIQEMLGTGELSSVDFLYNLLIKLRGFINLSSFGFLIFRLNLIK